MYRSYKYLRHAVQLQSFTQSTLTYNVYKNIHIFIFMSKNIFEVVNIDDFNLDFYWKSSFQAKKVWTSLS